jgi:flavin-binding protein dodecin
MADHTYGITEIVGTSGDSIAHAIQNGVERASQTVRNLDWFEVGTIRGHIEDGRVAHFQVQMKLGFRIETPDS